MNNLRILAISDTHRTHIEYTDLLSGCDLIVHAGDADCYDERTYNTFLKWAIKVSAKSKYGMIFVPGNHDSYISEYLEDVQLDLVGTNVHMLINETIEIGGLKIHGSHNSLAYGDLFTAFVGNEFELGKRVWNKIPQGLDVLVTHSPPFSVLDSYLGSRSLFERVQMVKPKIHIFGHIHQQAGVQQEGDTLFVNAASVGEITHGPYKPIEIIYDSAKRKITGFNHSTL